jgi:hypothetical protein
MQFAENIQANWQKGYCFIMTIEEPIQAKEPSREFKNYSGNILNIRLTAQTWPLVTSICLVPKRTALVASVPLMTKRLKWRCRSG